MVISTVTLKPEATFSGDECRRAPTSRRCTTKRTTSASSRIPSRPTCTASRSREASDRGWSSPRGLAAAARPASRPQPPGVMKIAGRLETPPRCATPICAGSRGSDRQRWRPPQPAVAGRGFVRDVGGDAREEVDARPGIVIPGSRPEGRHVDVARVQRDPRHSTGAAVEVERHQPVGWRPVRRADQRRRAGFRAADGVEARIRHNRRLQARAIRGGLRLNGVAKEAGNPGGDIVGVGDGAPNPPA